MPKAARSISTNISNDIRDFPNETLLLRNTKNTLSESLKICDFLTPTAKLLNNKMNTVLNENSGLIGL